jgi:hypothetical protein
MRAPNAEMIEYRGRIVGLLRLAIGGGIVGHVGGRIAARVIGDAAVAAGEMPHLRLPAAVIAGELVREDHRGAGPGLLVIEADRVIRGQHWHNPKPI